MPWFRIVATALLWVALTSGGEARAERDLYFHGDAFAGLLARRIRERYQGNEILKSTTVLDMDERLFRGQQFLPEHDPARIALRSWVLHQSDRTVRPEDLLMRAIELKEGNVQQGLMVAWDLLRERWSDADGRNFFPVTRKLIDITGEHSLFDGNHFSKIDLSDPFNPAKDQKTRVIGGDNYSAWYHIVGTMIHSFSASGSGVSPAVSIFSGRFRIFLEEHVGPWFVKQQFLDPFKRRKYDFEGTIAGANLFALLQKNEKPAAIPQAPQGYLYEDPAKLAGREKIDRQRDRGPNPGPTLVQKVLKWESALTNPTPQNFAVLLDAFRAATTDAERLAIVAIFGKWPGPEAVQRQLNLLDGGLLPDLREAIVAANMGRKDADIEPVIAKALTDESERVRSVAILLLEDRLDQPGTPERVAAALEDKSPLVRNTAAVVIHNHPQAVPAELRDAGEQAFLAAREPAPGTSRRRQALRKFVVSCRLFFSLLKEQRANPSF